MLNKDQSKPRGLISSLRVTKRGIALQVSLYLSLLNLEEKLIKVHQELPE